MTEVMLFFNDYFCIYIFFLLCFPLQKKKQQKRNPNPNLPVPSDALISKRTKEGHYSSSKIAS